MQAICDGVRAKREVLEQSIEEYKEVYVKARREFDTIVEVSSFPPRGIDVVS